MSEFHFKLAFVIIVAGDDFSPSVITFNYTNQLEVLSIIDDTIIEGNEYFLLNLSTDDVQFTVGNRSSLLILIKDDDGMQAKYSITISTVIVYLFSTRGYSYHIHTSVM